MVSRGYAIFDTAIGRCGIIWSGSGIVAVQLPEAREIDTRRRIFAVHPEAREQLPSGNAELAIEGIVALLQGGDPDFSEVSLDAGRVPGFHRRVYEATCAIPRGETRTYHEIARALGVSGAAHSVAQAISKNPYLLIVPCHRVLEAGNYTDRLSPYGGVISKRRLLALEGAHPIASKTLFEVLLPVAPPRAPS
ncbi:methylated-DNA--[protein]-cysteine S-methyltransferase [Bradyrhizobium diazoefficiens]|jgi:methylated-DNA-[protein]-cysteine S-methyltransferase|nr:methylated-DNA--[protein]-cysteine S-methyltransferase [Bradyrhizobium diazoefficiens]UCF55368.1 MAG: methylated-DNA--[protein]-cysteine S-methyltransferase [Bradyrhizobium sp.]MBR0968864.1 methylated-DNA--[protein]-cysteine S-methyltransferase [Bradyrhizobium diazoefficiens]MBR0980133.1 methylated-DNA--[protein]-cysteine S-methyltransferase [Bradyrhizobium diazoefficiens]MBR1009481.1 methylated-DNA--[protein]-cysteine S-methyltransferase [Bradyrhizobium diazoefficiens]MBR1016064.1 methylat